MHSESLEDFGDFENFDEKKNEKSLSLCPNQLQHLQCICIWSDWYSYLKKFAVELKVADITPLHKKLETINKENYRPVSLLPVVSKIFERLMLKQMKPFIETFLSKWLCGYRKGYNAQYALTAMVERLKKCLNERGGMYGAILMDLSKAFDTINHQLLIAKLNAYGFSDSALEIILSYLSDR